MAAAVLIDSILLQPCTRAEQPAANAVPIAAIACITDEGDILERSDGVTWAPYSPAPSASTPSNTVAPLGDSATPGAAGAYSRGDHVHAQALLTADPATPADDTWWVVREGTSPTENVSVKVRIGGATYTVAFMTR